MLSTIILNRSTLELIIIMLKLFFEALQRIVVTPTDLSVVPTSQTRKNTGRLGTIWKGAVDGWG